MHTGNNGRDWSIRRMSLAAIKDMDELYAAVYNKKPSKNYFHKKFGTAFAGIEYPGFIAYASDGTPIASLCVVPCYISYNGLRIVGAQLTDGMTHPSYRKKGLFSELESHISQLANDEGIDILFGFAVPATNPLLVKKGWYESEKLDRFVIPVPHSVKWFLQKIARKVGLKEKKSPPGFKPVHLANSVLEEGFGGIERSEAYLSYRSFATTIIVSTPTARAWVKTGNQLVIGDMEVKEKGFEEIIRRIQSMAEHTGANEIYFQCSKGTNLHRMFSQYYAAIPSFPVTMKNMRQDIDTARIKFTFADIDIF